MARSLTDEGLRDVRDVFDIEIGG
ncbi:MAG: hypothetical protein JWQ31_4174, partial [Mycobacterium sp.]|nr:hypothetical protein [Mycobacterium sp.]